MCGRANPGLWGFGPLLRQLGNDFGFVPLVVGACSIIFALTLAASGSDLQIVGGGGGLGGLMSFLSPSEHALLLFGMSGAHPVFGLGAWWTLLTASWLHGNLIHIVFNMYWIRRFGPDCVELIGPSRTVIIYVVSGVAGFLLSSTAFLFLGPLGIPFLRGGYQTMGASAAVLGLLGAITHYGRTGGSRLIREQAAQYIIWFVISGLIFPGTDNTAHLGGFLGGYGVSALMNPLARERGDHLIGAMVCLVATLLALVFSVVSNLPLLG
jgi:rhomboid protease GluP